MPVLTINSKSFLAGRVFMITYIFSLVMTMQIWSQSGGIKIGEWNAYLPFKRSNYVTQSDKYVYYGTDWGLVKINKSDNTHEFITKIQGLNDLNIQRVKYHRDENALLIAYANSNIDLMTADGIYNFREIIDNKKILGNKNINQINFYKKYAYLSTAFGLVQFDIRKKEFGFTTFTGFQVRASVALDNEFWMATDQGLYRASVNNPNLADLSLWEKLGEVQGLISSAPVSHLVVHKNELYIVYNQKIWRWDGARFILFFELKDFFINYLSDDATDLIVGLRCIIGCGNRVIIFADGQQYNVHGSCFANPLYAVQDGDRYWYADLSDDYRSTTGREQSCQQQFFNAPYSQNLSEIQVADHTVYVAAGGVNSFFGYQFRRDGLFIYKEGVWTYLNVFNTPEFAERELLDLYTVRVHPADHRVFIGSYLEGLIEWDGQQFKFYDEKNSTLMETVGDPGRVRISGLAFDRDYNLWVSNFLGSRPISVYQENGSWTNFNVPGSTTLTQIAIDRANQKWFVVQGSTAGLLVLNHGTTIENKSDDQFIELKESNSELLTNSVNCVEADRDGDIWVGTSQGVVVFNCVEGVFSGQCPGTRPKVTQDGLLAELLITEDVLCIAVDGANRKWFGTRNGLFVVKANISANDESILAHYNIQNSPLLDNTILDLAFDQQSGELYIGTSQGINVLRTEATAATNFHATEVYAFPNPVRPEYNGPIAIKGLAQDAEVRITDADGRLVYRTQALGGQAIWDGRLPSGEKVTTGVYLVFSTSSSLTNPESYVTKILVIK